ncbi:hypothetical protein K505DRAFT_294507 [Melanomma pulvis-pyrius CBS 109.77]|uniref:Uncharacterized protein n=1 Tax=Melanomma pulvis-pyrius CBS 109.77 TaxID=1314802 RepID=A0A6A6XSX6_9PLEO|nr:hypothetical protein K505DRAFT_294507 [Melanomma pulvis-pyrius CBS 109.77]
MVGDVTPAKVPLAGNIVSIILSMVTITVLAVCLIIIIIYADSTLFVFVTAIISRGFGINSSPQICEGGIILCLVCYLSTKVLIYYFLVEKAVRIAYINDKGVCIIGMQKIGMFPLISFDVVVNVYLTLLFIIPLRRLYSYQHNKNTALHIIAFRSFVGSCATLISSVVNLTILMALKGEPGWICLMCCNADILFSALVLHWVTQVDSTHSNMSSVPNQATIDLEHGVIDNTLDVPQTRRISNNNVHSMWPGHHNRISDQKQSLGIGGTVTTECRGASFNEGRMSEEEIIELHKIRVQTEHTQEVEIDSRSDSEHEVYNTYKGEERMSAEKMV